MAGGPGVCAGSTSERAAGLGCRRGFERDDPDVVVFRDRSGSLFVLVYLHLRCWPDHDVAASVELEVWMAFVRTALNCETLASYD